MSKAVALWSCVAILIGIIWGFIGNMNEIKSTIGMIIAIFSMIFAVVVMSFINNIIEFNQVEKDSYVRLTDVNSLNSEQEKKSGYIGLIFAILNGIFGGSIAAGNIIASSLNIVSINLSSNYTLYE